MNATAITSQVYTPYVIQTIKDSSALKKALKTKAPVIVITDTKFYTAFLEQRAKLDKGDTKIAKAILKVGGSSIIQLSGLTFWPLEVAALVLGLSSVADLGAGTISTVRYGYLKKYVPLIDATHHYIYLFLKKKQGYQNGCRIDTSALYPDTTQKIELRDPITQKIRIANVNDISPRDHI